jgi:hypothetical protein
VWQESSACRHLIATHLRHTMLAVWRPPEQRTVGDWKSAVIAVQPQQASSPGPAPPETPALAQPLPSQEAILLGATAQQPLMSY